MMPEYFLFQYLLWNPRRTAMSSQSLTSKLSSDSTDRISNLPDALLEHILSFLPTKQTVQTALLSRRWRFLWTLVPSLEFLYDDLSNYFGHPNFTFFVNKVFIIHRAQPLNRFCLRTFGSLDPTDADSWIVAATLRCVQELDLCIPRFPLPSIIFVSGTLQVLKLEDCVVNLPSSVYLPFLKILQLVDVIYPNCRLANAFMSRILSGCPVLEDLILNGYLFDDNFENDYMMLRICMPTLNRLEILAFESGSRGMYDKIEIKAPALKYLKICLVVCSDFWVDDSPNIIEVYFKQFDSHEFSRCINDLETRLNCIHRRVGTLRLQDVTWLDGYRYLNVPKFAYLKYLEFNCRYSKDLYAFCESCPNLEALILNQVFDDWKGFYWSEMPSFPECLLYRLKTFGYIGFVGSQDELDLVEYVMKYGLVLNLVIVEHHQPFELKESEEFEELESESAPFKLNVLKKLAAFPRSSRTCRLEFS